MDATPAGSKKAALAAAADAVPSSAAQHAAEQSSSPEPDAAVAAVKANGGGGEDDDEQVERFYALLDNIRAMRGMVSFTGGTAAGRKRAREAEPPWRPAFRMEDFELEEVDSDSVGCAGEKMKKESSERRPADDEEEEGEVVEAKGPRRGQSQPHMARRRRSGVLSVDT